MVKLQELVDHPDLGMRFICGPDNALSRSVAGACIANKLGEVHLPGPGWIILVENGLSPQLDAQCHIIRGGAERNLCAVAIRSSVITRASILQAEAEQVTLVSVRPDVPLRLIGYFVEWRLLQEDSDLRAHLQVAQWSMTDALRLFGTLADRALSGESVMPWRTFTVPSTDIESLETAWTTVADPVRAEFGQGMHVLALARPDGGIEGLVTRVESSIAELAVACIASRADRAILVVIPCRVAAATLIAEIRHPVHAGLSERFCDGSELRNAAQNALAALRQVQRVAAPPGTVRSARSLTLAEWLIASVDADELQRRVRQRFGQLRGYPELLATLRCWLTEDRSVRRAATSMHTHPNTIRYRLARVEEIMSGRLSDASVLTDLHVSLLAFPGELGMPLDRPG